MNMATKPTVDPKEGGKLSDLETPTRRFAAFASWFAFLNTAHHGFCSSNRTLNPQRNTNHQPA